MTVEEASALSRRDAGSDPGSDDAPEPIAAVDAQDEPELVDPATGAWTQQWNQLFQDLRLAPSDIEYLARAGLSQQQLVDIANQLAGVTPLDPTSSAPVPGLDAGSVASADGPLPADAASGASAWDDTWRARFTAVLKLMGADDAMVREQLATMEGQPLTEQQLQAAYDHMQQALGAFDPTWKQKFEAALAKVPGTAEERAQALQQIAGSGLDEATLEKTYQSVLDSSPGWSDEWKAKFEAQKLPAELVKQLETSNAPTSALTQQYEKLEATRQKYVADGRFDKLQEAGATNEELWGVMLQGVEGKDFDKALEQIHSAHVPMWKRVGSFALNFVPGVYALQYLTGQDWVTGEKIDRTNPLNIIGAVASGFAGFTAIRGAVMGVQGLVAANAAAQATKLAAGGAALADAVSGTSALSQGAFKAIQAAGLVGKFDKGLRLADYVKSAVPIINRFGEAGRLASVGRGYFQGMQLAAGTAALRTLANGSTVVDKATKATVLGELKHGRSIQEALAAAGRGSISSGGTFVGSSAGGFAVDAASVVRDTTRYGFLQGGAGNVAANLQKAGAATSDAAASGGGVLSKLRNALTGNGNFTFNPFKNTATISQTAADGVYALGRGVNFASNGGLAQGIGLVRGANSVVNPGLAAQAAARAASANGSMVSSAGQRVSGLGIANEVQRMETLTKTAEWAKKLGVSDGRPFRSLLQLGRSNRTAAAVTNLVENGGRRSYEVTSILSNAGSKYAGYVLPSLVGGAAFGMTGKQIQPFWDSFKERDESSAQHAERTSYADAEARRLREIYAREHGTATAPQPS